MQAKRDSFPPPPKGDGLHEGFSMIMMDTGFGPTWKGAVSYKDGLFSERKQLLLARCQLPPPEGGGLSLPLRARHCPLNPDELIEQADRVIEDGADDGARALCYISDLSKVMSKLVDFLKTNGEKTS